MFPQGSVRGNTIFTEVNEDVPSRNTLAVRTYRQKKKKKKKNIHGITIRGLAHENIVVVVVGKNFLDCIRSAGLELINRLLRCSLLLELLKDIFDIGYNEVHTVSIRQFLSFLLPLFFFFFLNAPLLPSSQEQLTLQMGLESFLGRLQALFRLKPDETELVLNVVDHNLFTFITTTFVGLLSRRVGSLKLEVLATLLLKELAAVALVEHSIVDLLDLVGISEELISRNDIL